METDRYRHRFRAYVRDSCTDLENSVLQHVGHFDRGGAGKLLHPRRLAEELQLARYPRRFAVFPNFNHLPLIVTGEKSMDGNRAAHIPETHVKGISLSVGVERLLVETVGPGAEEGNPAQRRSRPELLD